MARLRLFVMVLVLAFGTAGQALAQTPPAAQDEFRPVTEADLQEQLPAAGLVFTAYGIVWLVFAFYLFTLWRRLGDVETELRNVTSKLERPRG